MRVLVSSGLLYDDANPLCGKILDRSQGQNFAFVQCVEEKHPDDYPRRYWGRWDFEDEERSMREILECGGKWPNLPAKHPNHQD